MLTEAAFPELEEGSMTSYYEYAEQQMPSYAETKAAQSRRWKRRGAMACAGATALVAVSGLGPGWSLFAKTAIPFAEMITPSSTAWTVGARSLSETDWSAMFREFHAKYKKQDEYTEQSPEYYKRLQVFRQNALWISEYNTERNEITLAPNQFMDLDWKEFKARHLTPATLGGAWYINDYTSRFDGSEVLERMANNTLPEHVNWVDRGCVTPVKDQAHCGSCWAFSATGALEGAICAQSNRTVSLSEQQLVDCARPEGTMGCHGGFMENAFQYVIDNGGLCAEDAYPYEGVDGNGCRATACKSEVRVRSIMDLPPHNDQALRAALAYYGPVSVAIEADRPVFQFYHKGVMNLKCGKQLNHAVLAVGYGIDAKTQEHYWLIKNSWGATWGDAGYIKLTRDKRLKNGECGVLLAPVLPVVEVNGGVDEPQTRVGAS